MLNSQDLLPESPGTPPSPVPRVGCLRPGSAAAAATIFPLRSSPPSSLRSPDIIHYLASPALAAPLLSRSRPRGQHIFCERPSVLRRPPAPVFLLLAPIKKWRRSSASSSRPRPLICYLLLPPPRHVFFDARAPFMIIPNRSGRSDDR